MLRRHKDAGFSRFFVLSLEHDPEKPGPACTGMNFSEKIMLGQKNAVVAELVDALA
jgi:hypothetical protein